MSTWLEYHRHSEIFARCAEVVLSVGEGIPDHAAFARKLYRCAAAAEELAMGKVPDDHLTNFAVIAGNAAQLWRAAGEPMLADEVDRRYAADPRRKKFSDWLNDPKGALT